MRGEGLGLHHETMLLALRDQKGTVHTSVHVDFALGGALLAELLLSEKVKIVEPKKNKKLVELVDAKATGDEILDECLQRLANAKRRGSTRDWVMRFARLKKLKARVARELCRRGILREDEDTILLLFKRKIYPEVDPRPERAVLERLRRAIFSDTTKLDPHTVVLVSLAHATGILPKVFPKKELKPRKERIKSLVAGEVSGKAASEAVAAAHAAIVAATVAATAASTAATH